MVIRRPFRFHCGGGALFAFERRNKNVNRNGIREKLTSLSIRRACSGRSLAVSGMLP
jgi:hypothetical protein